MPQPLNAVHAGSILLWLSPDRISMRPIHCRLKPQEAWTGEMVIRLHEASPGSLSPEDDGTEAEE